VTSSSRDNSPHAGGIRRAELGSHKRKAIRQAIRSAGAKLFFSPKYSPDLNPIEQVFSKLKHLLRKDAARTLEAVCACIDKLLGAFTPQDCANYFRRLQPNLKSSRSKHTTLDLIGFDRLKERLKITFPKTLVSLAFYKFEKMGPITGLGKNLQQEFWPRALNDFAVNENSAIP
jgi:transposase